jgi:uncharacterized membrane protein
MDILPFKIEIRLTTKECKNLRKVVYQWQSQLMWLKKTEAEVDLNPSTLSWTRNLSKEREFHWGREMIKVDKQLIDNQLIKSIVHPMLFMVVELTSSLKIIEKFQKNLTILNLQSSQK